MKITRHIKFYYTWEKLKTNKQIKMGIKENTKRNLVSCKTEIIKI